LGGGTASGQGGSFAPSTVNMHFYREVHLHGVENENDLLTQLQNLAPA